MKQNRNIRRSLSAVSAAVLALCAAGSLSASAAETRTATPLMGDTNGDCTVNLKDAMATLRLYSDSMIEEKPVRAVGKVGAADVNMDGTVDLRDAQGILRYTDQVRDFYQPLWADLRKSSYATGEEYYGNGNAPFARTGMYLEIGCASGAPGEEVEVPVYIAGANKLAGFQLFTFIPEALECRNVSCIFDEGQEEKLSTWNPRIERIDLIEHFTPDGAEYRLGEDGEIIAPDVPEEERTVSGYANALVAAGADNLDISDGTVLAYFTYRIPEDAESGTVYPLEIDKATTAFVMVSENGRSIDGYQYTVVSGCVAVQ